MYREVPEIACNALWQRHDLRRTTATLAGRLGHPPHAIESLLGHLIGAHDNAINAGLLATYNQIRYETEAGTALQQVRRGAARW
jgi:hypothetical protein